MPQEERFTRIRVFVIPPVDVAEEVIIVKLLRRPGLTMNELCKLSAEQMGVYSLDLFRRFDRKYRYMYLRLEASIGDGKWFRVDRPKFLPAPGAAPTPPRRQEGPRFNLYDADGHRYFPPKWTSRPSEGFSCQV